MNSIWMAGNMSAMRVGHFKRVLHKHLFNMYDNNTHIYQCYVDLPNRILN